MPPSPVFILTEVSDPDPLRERWLLERAALLGRYAITQQRAPVVPALAIPHLWTFNDGLASYAQCHEWLKAQLACVASRGSAGLWVIEPDHGLLTPLMRSLVGEWKRLHAEPWNVTKAPWSAWAAGMVKAGLGQQAAALAAPPLPLPPLSLQARLQAIDEARAAVVARIEREATRAAERAAGGAS